MKSDRGLGLEEKRSASVHQLSGWWLEAVTISAQQLSDTALLLASTAPVLACTVLYCATVTNCPLFLSWGLHLKPYTRHMQPTVTAPGHLTSCLVNHDTVCVYCIGCTGRQQRSNWSNRPLSDGGQTTDRCFHLAASGRIQSKCR